MNNAGCQAAEKVRQRRSRIAQKLNAEEHPSDIRNTEGVFRSPRSIGRANGSTKCGPYLLASSLAAALPAERRVSARRGWAGENHGLFEQPAGGVFSWCTRSVNGVGRNEM